MLSSFDAGSVESLEPTTKAIVHSTHHCLVQGADVFRTSDTGSNTEGFDSSWHKDLLRPDTATSQGNADSKLNRNAVEESRRTGDDALEVRRTT